MISNQCGKLFKRGGKKGRKREENKGKGRKKRKKKKKDKLDEKRCDWHKKMNLS